VYVVVYFFQQTVQALLACCSSDTCRKSRGVASGSSSGLRLNSDSSNPHTKRCPSGVKCSPSHNSDRQSGDDVMAPCTSTSGTFSALAARVAAAAYLAHTEWIRQGGWVNRHFKIMHSQLLKMGSNRAITTLPLHSPLSSSMYTSTAKTNSYQHERR
jgi:hypothetical protein